MNNTTYTKAIIETAKQCLIDNGIEKDEADTVLQALGYILLNCDLLSCDEADEQQTRKPPKYITS